MNGQSHFWKFSLTVYKDPAVQMECLNLQDRCGIDVNLLLFCAFVGAVYGAVMPDHDIRQATSAVGAWHTDIVSRLRETRRALKPFATDPSPIDSLAQTLRTSVKAMELEAERLEQMMLAEWSASRINVWPRAHPAEAVAANVRTLLAICGPARQPGLPHRLVANALAAGRSAGT